MKYYPKIETPQNNFLGDSEDVLAWDFSTGSGKDANEAEWTYKGAPGGNGYAEIEWTYKGGPEENGYTKVEWTYLTAGEEPQDMNATSSFMGDDFF